MSEHSRPGAENPPSGRPLRFTIPELASLLGVSQPAVLGQIERGELLAIQEEHGVMVYVDLPELVQSSAPGNAGSATSAHDEVLSVRHAVDARGHETADRTPALPVPVAIPVSPVDLTLLVNLVTDLTRRNAELLDSTAQWRERVQDLEAELQRKMMPASTTDETTEAALLPEVDSSSDPLEADIERAARLAAEASVDRLRAELREIRRLQIAPRNGSLDPSAPKGSWWRRLVRGS